MGPVCSARKHKAKTLKQNDEFRTTNQPGLEATSLAGQSLPLEIKNQSNLEQLVQDLMQLFKRFSMFFDLVGNLDQLPQLTRDKLNNCIIIKQNISIIIQNNVKRVMREQQIIKRIDESDYYIIYNDRKFATIVGLKKFQFPIFSQILPISIFQIAVFLKLAMLVIIINFTNHFIQQFYVRHRILFSTFINMIRAQNICQHYSFQINKMQYFVSNYIQIIKMKQTYKEKALLSLSPFISQFYITSAS